MYALKKTISILQMAQLHCFSFMCFDLLFMNVIELSVGIDVSCERVFSGYKFDYYSFLSSIYWNGFCVIGFSIEQRLDFDG